MILTSLPLSDEARPDGGPPVDGGIEVSIQRGPLIGLLLLNALLTILTLGIYRFWARTKVRQRLWGAVSVGGDAFAYTGTGKELFIGFLVALVVLLPFAGGVAVINSLIPPTDIGTRLLVQFGIGLGAGLLGLTALYFARRYLLTRTCWRGVHGGQDRALGAYMAVHLKGYLLSIVTLGLIQPYVDAKTYNFRTGITWFGTERFAAAADTRGLWSVWLPSWLLFITGYGVLLAAMWPMMEWSAAAQAAQAGGYAPEPPPPFQSGPWIASAALILTATAGFYFYLVQSTVRFLGATQLGDMRFDLPVSWRNLVHIPLIGVLIYLGLLVLSAGGIALIIWASGGAKAVLALTPLIFLFLMLVLIGLVSVAWTQVEVLRTIGRHLRLTNIGVLDDILNRGQPAPSRGEGLADALGDVGIGA